MVSGSEISLKIHYFYPSKHIQTYLSIHPWNFKRIACLPIFNDFNKSNAPLKVLQGFLQHTDKTTAIILIFTLMNRRQVNLVDCGYCMPKQHSELLSSITFFCLLSWISGNWNSIKIHLLPLSSAFHYLFRLKKCSRFTWARLMLPHFHHCFEPLQWTCEKRILFCWIPGHAG